MAVRPPSTRLTHKIPNRVISNSWSFWRGAMFRRLVAAALPVEKRRTPAYLSEQCPACHEAGVRFTLDREDYYGGRTPRASTKFSQFAHSFRVSPLWGQSCLALGAWLLAKRQEPSTKHQEQPAHG